MTLSRRMKKLGVRSLALLLLIAASIDDARAEPGRNVHATQYRIGFLSSHAAEVLAWEQCPEEARDDCAVATTTSEGRLFLNVHADAATHERIARALALVIGTSKLDGGDESLVFLLTAVPAK
jgi:hypothetical protein